jgi:hypothetical protein
LENDHKYPVAAVTFAVAVGKLGAVYLYFLSPQTLVITGVATILVGAAGGLNNVFINLTLLYGLNPQLLYTLTLILSVGKDGLLLKYFNRITLDELMSPESTTTGGIPPHEKGINHSYPCALLVTEAVYL